MFLQIPCWLFSWWVNFCNSEEAYEAKPKSCLMQNLRVLAFDSRSDEPKDTEEELIEAFKVLPFGFVPFRSLCHIGHIFFKGTHFGKFFSKHIRVFLFELKWELPGKTWATNICQRYTSGPQPAVRRPGLWSWSWRLYLREWAEGLDDQPGRATERHRGALVWHRLGFVLVKVEDSGMDAEDVGASKTLQT